MGISTLCLGAVTAAILVIGNNHNTDSIDLYYTEAKDSATNYDNILYNHELFSYSRIKNSEESIDLPEEAFDFPELTEPSVDCSINSTYISASKLANETIYSLCKEYFDCQDVSFLLPMIISNNESAIRADKNITFSALYPSAVVSVSSVNDIIDFNCTRCLESADVFSVLGADWWTRDRGPVQMNPNYGIHDDRYNAALGKSEHAQLSKLNINDNMTAYTYKEGVINASYWVDQAAKTAGDRFNIKDICLRLSSEYNYALDTEATIYKCDSPILKMVMLSMYHGSGSVWMPAYTDTQIGYWNSGKLAYEYAQAISSNDVYLLIADIALSDVHNARRQHINPDIGISVSKAYSIYCDLVDKGYLKDADYYTSNGDYRIDYIVYPIKTIYNYAQLCILYNGG